MYILELVLIVEVLGWLLFWLLFRPLKRFKKTRAKGETHGEAVDSEGNPPPGQSA